jgi:hypothetical protein
MDPDEVNELGGGDVPLAFRMMEHLPSISASLGFALNRGSNTLLGGGFMDDRGRTPGFGEGRFRRRNIGPGKLGGFASGSMTPSNPTAKAYYGSSARRARLASSAGSAQGKMALGKGSRVNHITMRPRALARYNSLTIFNASQNTPFYSPFQFASKVVGNQFGKNAAFRNAVYGSTTAAIPEEGVFQRGMLSMITAGRKSDLIERKALSGSGRATKKMIEAQKQVGRLATMNNASFAAGKTFTGGQFGRIVPKSAGLGIIAPAGQTLTAASPMATALSGGNKVGLTGNLMASAGSTQASRYMQGYFRGALGHIDAGGLTDDAMRGASKAVSHFTSAVQKLGIAGPGYEKALQTGVFKSLGVKGTLQVAGTKTGAMALGARTAAMAIPGLNLLATASLVYDLGKMGGEVVKSGINLAKDAVKSMKGSMDKPLFGMGYKDNEVAATSRSRGVMAIQNSRLNARSALGSEAGMMASHFG